MILPTLAALLLAFPFQAPPSAPALASKEQGALDLSPERLEQLVAPIALYPDPLLAQLLMASTYPQEVLEAARWRKQEARLEGDALQQAMKEQSWDPSVKSLCSFPDVLARMSDNLDWSKDLGDAFLADQAKVMDAVQAMRRKAFDAGTLKSSEEQVVREEEDRILVIEPAEPEVIYVPTYYPTAVYGSWGYPSYAYPPLYAPPPAGSMFFSFTAGLVWGAAIWGDCNWGWGHTEIDIDIDRYNDYVSKVDRDGSRKRVQPTSEGRQGWKHDPEHRRGLSYQDAKSRERFDGARPAGSDLGRDRTRGYGDRSARAPSASTSDVRGQGPAGARVEGAERPGGERVARPSTTDRAGGSGARPSSSVSRDSGRASGSFSGARSPSLDRSSSARGSASRGSAGLGGSRGGGGRGGGGRGGRR